MQKRLTVPACFTGFVVSQDLALLPAYYLAEASLNVSENGKQTHGITVDSHGLQLRANDFG
jgi:hypothetical protein